MNKLFKIALAFSLTLFVVSCHDKIESPDVQDGDFIEDDYEVSYEANPRAFALKFTDFIGDGSENIKRLDADTVRISIKEGLLEYLKISELKPGDVLNIWENIDCPPYIRVVDNVEKTEAGYIVTTHDGNIGDIFQTLDACLDTELYCDVSDRPERPKTRSGSIEDYRTYVDGEDDFEQFIEDSGKIHPFIYYEANEDGSTYEFELAEETFDDMLESVLTPTRGFSWEEKWTIINVNKKHMNIYPKRDSTSSPVGLFVNDMSLAMKANLEFYFQFNVTESNKFWAKLDGNLDVEIPLHLRFEGKQLKYDKEVPVCEFMPIYTVFSLGPFVIPVMIRHGFIVKCHTSLNANFSFFVPITYSANFQVGPKYEHSKWSFIHKFEQHPGIDFEKASFLPAETLALTGGVGFYYHIGAYLGSAIGPFFEVGPKASITGNASLISEEIVFNTKANVALDGSAGAEVKLWKFNLGKYKKPFTIVSQELWNLDLKFKLEDLMHYLDSEPENSYVLMAE